MILLTWVATKVAQKSGYGLPWLVCLQNSPQSDVEKEGNHLQVELFPEQRVGRPGSRLVGLFVKEAVVGHTGVDSQLLLQS